jgi:hypothetical protein
VEPPAGVRPSLRSAVAALLAVAGFSAVAAGAAPLAAIQTAVPTSGLVAHWSFDEGSGTTAADSSGNGHTGTLAYSPTWTGAAGCRVGACISFDGADDHVKVANASQLQLTGDVTVAAWIKPTGLGTAQSIVSKRYEFELGHIASASPYALNWSHKNSSGTLVSGNLTSSTEAAQWQHVVLVRNAAAKQMTGYKNGALALTTTYTSAPGTSTYGVNIGRNPGGGQRFKGLIDEVRIYNRALTESEVASLFAEAS